MRHLLYAGDKHLSFFRKDLIGAGGEAEIFKIENDLVLKLYKDPDHPDYGNDRQEQEGARLRLEELQQKLPAFPKDTPSGLVVPVEIVRIGKKGGPVCGYTMPFVHGADVMCEWNEADFSKQHSITKERIAKMLHRLWLLVQEIHRSGIIIGDFNWNNVMIKRQGDEPLLIDADSMQFGPWLCKVYTEKFVDPSLCDPSADRPVLVKPHDQHGDWYAFTVQTMLLLLKTEPFGGIHRPKDKRNKVKHTARPMKRITVFDDEVLYPKPANPPSSLPKPWIDHYMRVFKDGERLQFPLELLESINWVGGKAIPVVKAQRQMARGKVTYEMLSEGKGYIIHATVQGGKLLLVSGLNGRFMREDGSHVLATQQQDVRFRVHGDKTYHAWRNSLLCDNGLHLHVDMYRDKLPMFDTNSKRLFWMSGGTLFREKTNILGVNFAHEIIGNSLEGQTLFWVGEHFGCGFYKAGELQNGFIFDEGSGSLRDGLDLPRLRGTIVDSTCLFSKDRCWLLVAVHTGKHTDNWCICINAQGNVLGLHSQEAGTPGWLGHVRGKMAAADFLLCATDEGIVRCGLDNNQDIVEQKLFEDTKDYVDSSSHLLPGPGGLYVVDHHEVGLLKIG